MLKNIAWIVVTITVLELGVSCSKETPNSDKDSTQKTTQDKVGPEQKGQISPLSTGKTDVQKNLASTNVEVKMEPNDMEINRPAQVFLWWSGAKKQLDSDQSWVVKLQRDCEILFTSADDALWEVVTKETLHKARENVAIELIYKKRQHFNVEVDTKSMDIDGLLIPLNPLHGNTVVIYHRLGSYSAGPLINSDGKKTLDQLRQMLIKHGVLTE